MWTALVLAVSVATPKPAATPPPEIIHERVTPLCTGLRQNIGPAIGKVLQNDATIAQSRPLLRGYVKAVTTGSASKDLQVSRVERLISPLVKNTAAIEKLLNDPYVFPRVAKSESDKQLLEMRAYLQQVVAQQKAALDVINGFVTTEQLGQLQQEGREIYQNIAANHEITSAQGGAKSPQALGAAPSPPPSEILTAGVTQTPMQQSDPALQDNGFLAGHNPLDVFDWAIGQYQAQLQSSEGAAANLVVKALPLCGGRIPGT